ncbi:hypothetical protein DOY81_004026 [Sarcophaga bullata]|nr:hypothetical protein DOY81_004026 [Sarcophaga bullata]
MNINTNTHTNTYTEISFIKRKTLTLALKRSNKTLKKIQRKNEIIYNQSTLPKLKCFNASKSTK